MEGYSPHNLEPFSQQEAMQKELQAKKLAAEQAYQAFHDMLLQRAYGDKPIPTGALTIPEALAKAQALANEPRTPEEAAEEKRLEAEMLATYKANLEHGAHSGTNVKDPTLDIIDTKFTGNQPKLVHAPDSEEEIDFGEWKAEIERAGLDSKEVT